MKARAKDTLLLIGDGNSDRKDLRKIFDSKYYLLEAENAEQGVLLLQQNTRYIAAVVTDIPLGDGTQLRSLVEACRADAGSEIPVIALISPLVTGENEEYAFVLGADDVVLKPYTPLIVRRRVQLLVNLYLHQWQLETLVQQQEDTIRNSNQTMLETLSSIIEYRSTESGNHVLRIRRFTLILLEEMAKSCPEYGLDETTINIITSAAVLHDIGKISIPDSILNKPGKLTEEEFEIMKSHTTTGAQLVAGLQGLGSTIYQRYIYNIALYHHERWDGKGYPEGRKGDDIPICAQIVGLTDAFDALTTQRVYKPAYPYDTAVNMILNGECGAFSPMLLEAFKRTREQLVALAHQYADGYSPKSDEIRLPLPESSGRTHSLSSTQLSQQKYQALLHHIGDTIIEMDLENRIYHVVYNPNPDFVTLLTGTPFDRLSQRILQDSIHPEDAPEVARQYGEGMMMLFRRGRHQFRFRCRMYSPPQNTYIPYEITTQRVNTGNPDQRILLMIFHRLTGEQHDQAPEQHRLPSGNPAMYDLSNAALCCMRDEPLTIVEGAETLPSLTGFTLTEIWQQFKNRLLELVVPEDRETLLSVLRGQNIRSGRMELEFRLRRSEGDPLWVLCRCRVQPGSDGEEHCYMTLTDVSRLKHALLQTEALTRRHRLIAEQSESAIFEWDLQSDRLSCTAQFKNRFGYSLPEEGFARMLFSANRVHPDDLPLLREKATAMRNGTANVMLDLRIASLEGKYLWSRIRATTVYDTDGTPSHVIGIIYNIDGLKTDAISLQQQAQQDALTKLMNKISTQRAIEAYLQTRKESAIAAVLLLDLDNFKAVNDTQGHMYGDAVLAQVGTTLRNLFRSKDVVGRIGGDEFMILLKDLPDQQIVDTKCHLLVETFRMQLGRLMPGLPISVSVGAAVTPADGVTFSDLYRHADEALYTAKRRGKNRYKIYSAPDKYDETTKPENHTTQIDSETSPSTTENVLFRYVFQHLHDREEMPAAINGLLALLGTTFNLSRVYIFETNADDTCCSNTYEWCNRGIRSVKQNLQNLRYGTDLPHWSEIYNRDGVFFFSDTAHLHPLYRKIAEQNGACSVLHCAIMEKDIYRGFVGFDDCTAGRQWSQHQIERLQLLAEALSVFLARQRENESGNGGL